VLEKIKHNLGIKIMAVVLAVLIWFVVYINDNPIETRQLTIPLSVVNEEALTADNLRVLNEYSTEVEIFVRGRKADVDSVSSNDFIAYLDFNEVEDENTVFLTVTDLSYLGERNISTGFSGSGRIGVSIDRIVTGEVPINVVINGEPADGFSVVGTILKPANYIAIDIKSLVQEVDRAEVEVDVNELRGTETIRKLCMVYDEYGNVINELSNQTAVDITVSIAKNIPVNVVTEGAPATDYLMTKTEALPDEVLITGSEEDLSKINSISTLPVSLSGATESFTAQANLSSPPSGTAFVGTGNVDVEVHIEGLYEKTLPISANNITIRWGTPTQRIYSIIEDGYSITLKGRQGILDSLTLNSISPYIDVSTVEDGESSLPLRFQNLGSLEQITYPLVRVYTESLRNIEVETDLITINGMDVEKYSYAFETETETMEVRGISDDLNEIDVRNLRMSVDAAGLEPGTQEITVNVTLPNGVVLSDDLKATLIISDKINE